MFMMNSTIVAGQIWAGIQPSSIKMHSRGWTSSPLKVLFVLECQCFDSPILSERSNCPAAQMGKMKDAMDPNIHDSPHWLH